MLLLTFHIGNQRYAIEARQIVEIAPMVELTSLPLADQELTGIFNYRGMPVPVIDLCELYEGRPSRAQMSTRIVLLRQTDEDQGRIFGLVAEQVTECISREPGEFKDVGMSIPKAPFLRGIAHDEHGPIQLIDIKKLLPGPLSSALFSPSEQVDGM